MLFAKIYILHSEELLVDLAVSEQMSCPCDLSDLAFSQFCQNTNIPHWMQAQSEETTCQEWKVNTLKTQHSAPEEPKQCLTVPPVQLQAHSVKMLAVGKGNTKTLSC